MKRIIIILLLLTGYTLSQPGQGRYQGRSGYQQSIIWNDLHKSLQDTLRNVIGDSANANIHDSLNVVRGEFTDSLSALTASNGVVYSGRDFSQKIVKDTTTLKAYTPDSASVIVYLKQLSSANTNGGGVFVFQANGTGDHIISYDATGGGIWIRQAYLDGAYIDPKWAGAMGDGVTDDKEEIQSAVNRAVVLDVPVIFPAGDFRITDPIYVPDSKGQNDDFQLWGSGRHKTTITATDTAFGRDRVGYTRGIYIRDMQINGPGKATANSIGLNLSFYTNPKFENLYIENFEKCIDANRVEGALFERCFIEDNVWGSYLMGATLNGNTFLDCYWGASDSIQNKATNCNGLSFIGGEGGNAPVFLELSDEGGGFGNAQIFNMNLESCDSTFFIVNNLSDLKISGTKVLLASAGDIDFSAYAYGDSRLFLDRVFLTNGNIYAASTNSRIILSDMQQRTAGIRIYRADVSTYLTASVWEDIQDNALFAPDSGKMGRLVRMYSRKSTNVPERLYYYHRFSTTEFSRSNLLTGSDWRVATTDVQPAAANNIRIVAKFFNVTFSASGDSTEYTAIVDTNGFSTIYWADLVFDDANNSGKHNVTTGWEDSDGANAAGTIDFLIWHNGDATLNGVTRRMRMLAVIVPREWGSN